MQNLRHITSFRETKSARINNIYISTSIFFFFQSHYSRTLRQFNQDQKTGKIIANRKLNTRGVIYTSKEVCLLDTSFELRPGGVCNFYVSDFYSLLMILRRKICDVTIIKHLKLSFLWNFFNDNRYPLVAWCMWKKKEHLLRNLLISCCRLLVD